MTSEDPLFSASLHHLHLHLSSGRAQLLCFLVFPLLLFHFYCGVLALSQASCPEAPFPEQNLEAQGQKTPHLSLEAGVPGLGLCEMPCGCHASCSLATCPVEPGGWHQKALPSRLSMHAQYDPGGREGLAQRLRRGPFEMLLTRSVLA